MTLIIAHDKNFGIGKDGKLPWRISEDLRHFKEITMGQKCLVGRKTFETLPPLPGRTLIVASFNSKISDTTDLFIIGGKQIYEYCLQNGLVHTAIVTEINGEWECDTFMDKNFLDGFIKVDEKSLSSRCKVCKYVRA